MSSALAFERAQAQWRAAVAEHLPLIILRTGCTYVVRDGARYGAGILNCASRRSQ